MAAPNIAKTKRLVGRSVGAALATTSADIVTNGSASGRVLKVDSISAANIHASSNADVTVSFFDASASASYRIAPAITVPTKATLAVLANGVYVYLEEGDKIVASASANSSIELVVTFVEISEETT